MLGTPPPNFTKNKFHPDAELSYTLPGFYYYDPDVYAREVETIWFKSWIMAGYTHELAEPGSYITRDFLDQTILVVRGKDMKLRAFHNVCMHRGHELVKGKGKKLIFTCPYHAWSYDAEGKLKAAGNAENVKGFAFDEFGLSPVRVDTLLNMVFVNLDPKAKPVADVYPGLEAEVRQVLPGYDNLKFFRADPYRFKSNWKFVFDAMECYHCPSLHPQAMGRDAYYQQSFEVTDHGLWQTHIIRGNPAVINREIQGSIAYDLQPNPPIMDVWIWWIWPNIYLTCHMGNPNMKILFAMPDGLEWTWETVDNFLLEPFTAADISNVDNFRDNIQAQDVSAMESQQRGVRSRGYAQGRLIVDAERTWASEHGVHHFNKLVWEKINGPDSYGWEAPRDKRA
ncbi:MAG: aromatic ring-hydroxylating dioxygenase subunit alpha [Alphaproteobacteria bacterium]|nr:aromatic ring-hydroxylating dioxygenase subunit alpha [Alphaproteobacteria bacterium]